MGKEEHRNQVSESEFARLLEEKRPDDIAHYHWPVTLLRVASNARSYSEAESVMRSYYAQQVLRRVGYKDKVSENQDSESGPSLMHLLLFGFIVFRILEHAGVNSIVAAILTGFMLVVVFIVIFIDE